MPVGDLRIPMSGEPVEKRPKLTELGYRAYCDYLNRCKPVPGYTWGYYRVSDGVPEGAIVPSTREDGDS
jgi:hypothetical protein